MKKLPIKSIALDDETFEILEELKKYFRSTSKAIREVLKFYYENKELESSKEKLTTYVEMLTGGEHVILDVDHWITFLNFIETHPESERFWELHKEIAKAHAEEFKNRDVDYIIERLHTCNFFTLVERNSEYILVLSNEKTKKFVKDFLLEVFSVLGFNIEIKEDLMKLRIKIQS